MRKSTLSSTLQVFLMFLVALFASGANALAEETLYKTLTFSKETNGKSISSYTETWTATIDEFTWSIANFNNNKNGWQYIKCGRKDNPSIASITNTTAFDQPVSRVAVTIDKVTTANVNSIKLIVHAGDVSSKATETIVAPEIKKGTLEFDIAHPDAANVLQLVFDCKGGSANGIVQVSKVEYYATTGGGGEVTVKAAAPELTAAFSFEEDSREVTITNKEEGGTVYYTTDGSDPTTESEHFTEASKTLVITATTTVKAMATATGKDNSRIVSATYTKKEPAPTYKTVAEFIAARPETEARLQLTNALVYGNKGNMNIFLHDGTGMIQLFDGGKGLPAGIKYGTRVTATFAGTYLLYSGQHEMKDAKLVGEATITEADTPYGMKEVTAAEVTEEMVGQLVTVKGVTFQADKMDKGKVIVKDGETALTIYNSLRITVPTTLNTIQKANVSGFVLQYVKNENEKELQIVPVTTDFVTYTPQENTLQNIAEFLAAKPTEPTKVQLANALVYGNVENKNIYVYDGTGMVQLYNSTDKLPADIVYGTRLTAVVEGTYGCSRGQDLLKDAKLTGEYAVTKTTTPYEAKEVKAADVTAEMTGQMVTVMGVTFQSDKLDAQKVEIKDGEAALTVHNALDIALPETFVTDQKANVRGFVMQDDDNGQQTLQIIPVSYEFVTYEEKTRPELSFEKALIELPMGETAVSANALTCNSDGAVTYSSSDENVATVAQDGTVTFVGCGLATITATAAATGSYAEGTASYKVLFLSGDGTWEHPYSPVDVINSTSIKDGADITVAGYYVGYPGQGDAPTADKFENSAMALSSVTEGVSAENTIPAAVHKNLREGITTEDNIGQWVVITAKKNKYFSKPGINKPGVDQRIAIGKIEMDAEGYATFYSAVPAIVPEGLQAGLVTVNEQQRLLINYCYGAGEVIPAKTGVLLKGAEGSYPQVFQAATTTVPAENLLHGTITDQETAAPEAGKDYRFYKLSLDNDNQNLGFYWGAEDGAAFTNKAGRAYLAIEKTAAAVKGFSITDLETGIGHVNGQVTAEDGAVYDLQGRRVEKAVRGMYIQNGRKFMVK